MPARNQPAPLTAKLAQASVTIGGTTYPHPFVNPIMKYTGKRLFLKASSDGTILKINIDDAGPDDVAPPANDATVAEIIVTYAETTTPEHWDIPNISYKANTPITLGVQLDQKWANATLLVGAPAAKATDEASLDYVVVHGAADPLTGEAEHYDLYWLLPGATFDADTISGATFVPDPGGGMTGPFGISLP